MLISYMFRSTKGHQQATLLIHSQAIEFRGYIYRSITITSNLLDLQQYSIIEYYKLCNQNKIMSIIVYEYIVA
jgi:hypothetical protein